MAPGTAPAPALAGRGAETAGFGDIAETARLFSKAAWQLTKLSA